MTAPKPEELFNLMRRFGAEAVKLARKFGAEIKALFVAADKPLEEWIIAAATAVLGGLLRYRRFGGTAAGLLLTLRLRGRRA